MSRRYTADIEDPVTGESVNFEAESVEQLDQQIADYFAHDYPDTAEG